MGQRAPLAPRTTVAAGCGAEGDGHTRGKADEREKSGVAETYARIAGPVVRTAEFRQMAAFTQHGDTSTMEHCEAVAYFSLAFARAMRLRLDERSLVRGALLHDYFLYDWHDHAPVRWHGFTHPRRALENASRDFALNGIERDLIAHHMFPFVPAPPHHREGWVVTLADKYCTLREVFMRRPYAPLEGTVM